MDHRLFRRPQNTQEGGEENSETVRARVIAARDLQLQRQGKTNSLLQGKEVERICAPDAAANQLLDTAMRRFGLSARAYHRILKVARSVADLGHAPTVGGEHVSIAVKLRCFDLMK